MGCIQQKALRKIHTFSRESIIRQKLKEIEVETQLFVVEEAPLHLEHSPVKGQPDRRLKA